MKIIHVVALTAMVGLSACGKTEPVQTVDWYKAHDAERQAMVDRCHANPGELAMTPNCINASQASNVKAAERRGYVLPAPIHAKIGG
ncbi:MAG: EexN family lipoprotein [Rhodanobacter sp.]